MDKNFSWGNSSAELVTLLMIAESFYLSYHYLLLPLLLVTYSVLDTEAETLRNHSPAFTAQVRGRAEIQGRYLADSLMEYFPLSQKNWDKE